MKTRRNRYSESTQSTHLMMSIFPVCAFISVLSLSCHTGPSLLDSMNSSEAAVTRMAANGNEPSSGDSMVLIPGGTVEIGIAEEDLKELVEMGKKVPHMNELLAKWWFGDEIPEHTVELDSYYMDVYEVTNRQFAEFVHASGYDPEGEWETYATEERADHPVVNVTWNDASAYAKWAGKRLPTEAEWEWGAKGGKAVKWFPWGNSPDPTRANYRYQGESFLEGIPRLLGLRKINTKPVGSYEPNGYGFYDICGNVSEWCHNDYERYPGGFTEEWIGTRYGPFKENQEPVRGKVVRGGNWDDPNAVFIRITKRRAKEPNSFERWLGFRCARSAN